jgi:hypothetical protein
VTDVTWIPEGVDLTRPSAARIYDHLLGGGHNFAADRAIAAKLVAVQPNVATIARRNRAFLRRAVLFMIEQGVRQFLDLGSGIPTVGNVHEIAQRVVPDARIVYVDSEDVAVAHSTLMLRENPFATMVQADVTRPDDVLGSEGVRRLLDLDEPVGLLAVTLGHYISPEQDPVRVFARYRDAVPSGSLLALTHFTDDFAHVHGDDVVETMRSTQNNVFPRTRDEVLELFAGFELVEPGLVTTSQWRPEPGGEVVDDPSQDGLWVGAGRKP